jgi:release factor glutamine methyltransferase
VNSPQKTSTIKDWIDDAAKKIASIGIESTRLDAELILAHTLRKPRTFLHAHGDELIDAHRMEIANARLDLRLERTPIAYIVGHREFYGRRFKTTPAALIPRIESEAMIDVLNDCLRHNRPINGEKFTLLDIGTGSGCLGITAKLEWQNELDVYLTDISPHALSLAKENAVKLKANVSLLKMDMLKGWSQPVDFIMANLPYVDEAWDVSPEILKEPSSALFSENKGLSHIFDLIVQALPHLHDKSHLLIESDRRQQDDIIRYAEKNGFFLNKTVGLICDFTLSQGVL